MNKVIHYLGLILVFLWVCSPGISEGSSWFDSYHITKCSIFPEPEDVRKILEDYIKKIFQNHKTQVEVREVKVFNTFSIPSRPLFYEILLPINAYRGGNISATILFYLTKDEVKRVRTSAKLDIFTEVVVANRHLPKHHIISEKDIELIFKNVSTFSSNLITHPNDVLGKRTTLSINPGEILREGMVENHSLGRSKSGGEEGR